MSLSQREEMQLRALLAQIAEAGKVSPMSTPMSYIGATEFWCCLCYEVFPHAEATWDPDRTTRVNVCMKCRINETYWMIRKLASYG